MGSSHINKHPHVQTYTYLYTMDRERERERGGTFLDLLWYTVFLNGKNNAE